LKTVEDASPPGVRIPHSPPILATGFVAHNETAEGERIRAELVKLVEGL